jgi:cytochrome b subunit of formate dehydrogenase
MNQSTQYQRFDVSQRIEHALMLTSFSVLAVTGLPQKFVAADWARLMIQYMGGIEVTRQIHHFAAIVLMIDSVYHVVSAAYRLYVRRAPLSMLPSLRDAQDALQHLLYNVGLRKDEPQGGRFTYMEKAEYWALIWGTLVMIITGFMMWNPIATASFLPGQVIPAAKAAHGGEAILAVAAVILWHFYSVHLRHLNLSMFTGRLSEHEMADEHPLELADLKAGKSAPAMAPAVLAQRRRMFYPVAGVLSAAVLFGIYGFVSFEQTAQPIDRAIKATAYNPLTPTPLPTPRPTPSSIPLQPIWDRNIGLVLQTKCGECHSADSLTAGLDLTTYISIMQGGRDGPVIIPGNPDGSLLVQKQEKNHPGRLTGFELQMVKDWIKAGAPRK